VLTPTTRRAPYEAAVSVSAKATHPGPRPTCCSARRRLERDENFESLPALPAGGVFKGRSPPVWRKPRLRFGFRPLPATCENSPVVDRTRRVRPLRHQPGRNQDRAGSSRAPAPKAFPRSASRQPVLGGPTDSTPRKGRFWILGSAKITRSGSGPDAVDASQRVNVFVHGPDSVGEPIQAAQGQRPGGCFVW